MGRGLIEKRKHMQRPPFPLAGLMRYERPFPVVIPHFPVDYPRVTHPCATLLIPKDFHVRLACVRHAASVQSEPESNSPVEKYLIQRTEVLKSNSKLYFPNSLFTCQRTAAAHQRRRCFMHHLLLPVNNFFQSFFGRRFGELLFPVP